MLLLVLSVLAPILKYKPKARTPVRQPLLLALAADVIVSVIVTGTSIESSRSSIRSRSRSSSRSRSRTIVNVADNREEDATMVFYVEHDGCDSVDGCDDDVGGDETGTLLAVVTHKEPWTQP